MQNERQKKILEFIVREYSKKSEPIGSAELRDRKFPDLSSATLRRDLLILSQGGYLEQPHTSAGRIPTDKAYKWFINEKMASPESWLSHSSEDWQKKLGRIDEGNFFSESARVIARFCGGLGISYSPGQDRFFKYGLPELFSRFSEMNFGELSRIMEDVENLDERIGLFLKNFCKTERSVFVGRESPITKSENLSVISRFSTGEREGLFLLVGPKNMLYDRNLAILEAIAEIYEE